MDGVVRNMTATEQKNKIHPHKFTLWVAIGSILMMFAGFTSAYIVKRNQPKWETFDLPHEFWYSTLAIVLSSITISLAVKAFKSRNIPSYRMLMIATLVLGSLFIILQFAGFNVMMDRKQTMQANASFGFLYVIIGLHVLHVLGGIIAILVQTIKAFASRQRSYNSIPIEVTATYWHFVDILWIYLLVFFWLIR